MTRARGASRPRFRLLPTVLLTLTILLLPTVVYAWGRSSSSFAVTTITVTGTHLVREKQALRLLRRDYAGRNLFTVTGKDVRTTLEPLSFVSGARVDRDFPHTLAVTLTEHEPVAYGLAGERWYVLDRDGYVVCRAAAAAEQLGGTKTGRAAADPSSSGAPSPAAEQPASAAAAEQPPSAASATSAPAGATGEPPSGDGDGDEQGVTGRLVAGPERAVLPLPRIVVSGRVREGAVAADAEAADMLRVITALPRSLQRRLAAVENDDGQLVLRFDGGPLVAWGDAGRIVAKTVALRTVLREYESADETCTHMDVSMPDRTLARPVLR